MKKFYSIARQIVMQLLIAIDAAKSMGSKDVL
jgi:hypothetical protein